MSRNVLPVTFGDVVRPRVSPLAWSVALVLAGGTAMALFARISIPLPFTPVPITGQTFGVLLIGALLGRARGSFAMLVYLGEGLAGLPVFAGGASAWSPSVFGTPVIIGPTAGYLFACPIAAFVVGWLAERGWDRRFWSAVAAMLAGETLFYLVGVPWLAIYIGPAHAIALGLLPFISGDVLKLLLAAAALPTGWRVLRTLAPDLLPR